MMNGGFELLYKVLIYKMVHSDLQTVRIFWKLLKMDKIVSDQNEGKMDPGNGKMD